MNSQTSSISIPVSRRSGRRRHTGLLVGTLAVAVVLAGAGFWQSQRDSGRTQPASEPATAMERPVKVPSVETPTTIYVVASAEQEAAVLAALDEANVVRLQRGEAPMFDQVLLVPNDDMDVLQVMNEQDAIRASLGLPSLTVVDLRGQVATAAPVDITAETAAGTADTRGGLAELIRDGGTRSLPAAGVPAGQDEETSCGAVAGPIIC